MRKIALLCVGFGAMLALALPVAPARAATNMVSYVSGNGDTNPANTCSNPATPCRSFTQALTNTGDQGTVVCVGNGVSDDGVNPFGSTTISKSVTIDCGAATMFSLGIMNINGPGIVVRLRNMSFDGSGVQNNYGISVVDAAEVYVENCRIHNYSGSNPGAGINFAPSGGSRSRLTVANSVITDSGLSSLFGSAILVNPSGAGPTEVTIERTRLEGNGGGVIVNADNTTGQVQVQIKDSVLAHNNLAVFGGSDNTALMVVSVINSHVVANTFGVFVTGPQAIAILDKTTIQASTNQAVNAASGAVIFSYGNNPINNNAAFGTSLSVIGQH
jgi:hypothetical protein